jgi:hypothetical protein
VTREEFDGGWRTLKGVWPKADQSPDVYFGVLNGLDAWTWGHVVREAIKESTFFPHPTALLDSAYSVERERRRNVLAFPPPPIMGGNVLGHPACPARDGEHFFAYLERLAVFLGYISKPADPIRPWPEPREAGEEG